ncbi:MAG: hypothetical protein JW990_03840, partial [Thermoleophilia bacterium]|nr:hypothetical protein [Thermoleophilia bacterium]
MKADALNKLKFRVLQARLGLSLFEAVGVLEALWLFAKSNALQGDVGRFSNDEIAMAIGWARPANELIEALTDAPDHRPGMTWLDEHPEHRLIIHDWAEHLDGGHHAVLARRKLRFADGSMPKLECLFSAERKAAKAAYDLNDKEVKPTGTKQCKRTKPPATHGSPMETPRVTHGSPNRTEQNRTEQN